MAECRAARQAQTARSASPTVPACALTRPEPAAGWRVPTDVSCMVRVLSLKVVERDDEGDAGDRGSDRTPGGTCARDSTQAGTAKAEQRRGQLRRPQRERPARTPRAPHAPHTPHALPDTPPGSRAVCHRPWCSDEETKPQRDYAIYRSSRREEINKMESQSP